MLRLSPNILDRYFAAVWPPFLVYLGVYLLSWALKIPVKSLTTLFQWLHGLHAAFLLVFAVRYFKRYPLDRTEVLFWLLLFLLFLAPGAYLEYPSDVWEHFRRILSWQNSALVSQNEDKGHFAYFLDWTWLSWASISERRYVLTPISAFWQLLVAIQFRLLLRELKLTRNAQWVGVIAWLAFFGTNLFGIRYYALSATPLAMVALFAALIQVCRGLDQEGWSPWVPIPFLILLMEMNHPRQELAGFLVGTAALIVVKLWPRFRKPIAISVGAAVLTGLIFYKVGYRFHHDELRIVSTLGVHGFVGVLAALFLLRRQPRLAALCVAPVLVLWFSPARLILMKAAGSPSSVYRVLFAFPTSVAFGIWLYEWLERKWTKAALPLSLATLMGLGLIYWRPFYGRFYFQIYHQDPVHTLRDQDIVADWFDKNRKAEMLKQKCRIFADDTTYFAIATQLGLSLHGSTRSVPFRYPIEISKFPKIANYLDYYNACGVLLPRLDRLPTFNESPIGRASGHWRRDQVDIHQMVPKDVESFLVELFDVGLRIVEVPPYYWYLEATPELWEEHTY